MLSSFVSAQEGSAESAISEIGGKVLSSILNVAVLGFLGFLAAIVVGWVIYYFFFYRKKFNIEVKIISQRADDPYNMFDKAAYLYDRKNKINYLKLWSLKKEFQIPTFNIMQTSNRGDYLELLRKSEDEFVFLTKPKIDTEWIIKADGKKYPMARIKQRQIESDYYWLMRRKEQDKSWIDPESFWTKIIQMAPILIPGVLMIVVFLFFLNSLPEILRQLGEVIEKTNTLQGVISNT
jgi:hypothetical protein